MCDVLVFQKSANTGRRSKHARQNSVFSPDARAGTWYALALLLQRLRCPCIVFLDIAAEDNNRIISYAVHAEPRISYQIIEEKHW